MSAGPLTPARPPPQAPSGCGTTRLAGLALALGLATGCATVREALGSGPQAAPAGRDGWTLYTVGDLRFEAPSGWAASGSAERARLEAPEGDARLDARLLEARHPAEKECLAAAEASLRAGEAGLERVRRAPTRFAGRPGIVQEADAGGWHGWAYAACDGGTQYRVFFTARSPASPAAVEAWKALLASARIGGRS
jgi:hypothetical protein